MTKFSLISHYRLKNGIRSHWTLLSMILMQLLLCSAKPDQYNPNPDGIEVRHVPAKNRIHAEPIRKQTLIKRAIDEETTELLSENTTYTDDSSKDTENSSQEENESDDVIGNNMNDIVPDEDSNYEETDKAPYPQTYPETKQSFTATAKITPTMKPITVSGASELTEEFPSEDIESSTFGNESNITVITTTSLTPNEIVSEHSHEKPANSDHFIENISNKNDSLTRSIGFRQSYELFTLLIPMYLYLF